MNIEIYLHLHVVHDVLVRFLVNPLEWCRHEFSQEMPVDRLYQSFWCRPILLVTHTKHKTRHTLLVFSLFILRCMLIVFGRGLNSNFYKNFLHNLRSIQLTKPLSSLFLCCCLALRSMVFFPLTPLLRVVNNLRCALCTRNAKIEFDR